MHAKPKLRFPCWNFVPQRHSLPEVPIYLHYNESKEPFQLFEEVDAFHSERETDRGNSEYQTIGKVVAEKKLMDLKPYHQACLL